MLGLRLLVWERLELGLHLLVLVRRGLLVLLRLLALERRVLLELRLLVWVRREPVLHLLA